MTTFTSGVDFAGCDALWRSQRRGGLWLVVWLVADVTGLGGGGGPVEWPLHGCLQVRVGLGWCRDSGSVLRLRGV